MQSTIMKRTARKWVSIIIVLAMIIGYIQFPETAYAEYVPLPVVNPGFESLKDGTQNSPANWTFIGTASAGTATAVTTEDGGKVYAGERSLKIVDNATNGAVGVRSDYVTDVTVGTEYITSLYYYAESGVYDLMLDFCNEAPARIKDFTTKTVGTGEWRKLTSIGKAPANTAQIRLILNSTSANTGTAYFDEVTLGVLTEELVYEYIDEKILYKQMDNTQSTNYLMEGLKSDAAGLTGVVDSNKEFYFTALSNARTQKGSALTKVEIQTIINQINQEVADAQSVNNVKAALTAVGLTMTLSDIGEIPVPEGATEDGVTASWTSVSGDTNGRITISGGTATLNSRPGPSENDEVVMLTLTLSKGTASSTLDYTVTISKEASADDITDLDLAIQGGNVAQIYEVLIRETLGLTGVIEQNATLYRDALVEARNANQGPLTKDQVQTIIDDVNIKMQNEADVASVEATLLASSREIVVYLPGIISIPQGATANGVSASWTAVSGEGAGRITLSNGTATVMSVPSDIDETANLTLRISKGEASATIDYTLIIKKQLLKSIPVPNHSFEEDDGTSVPAVNWTVSQQIEVYPDTGVVVTNVSVSDEKAYTGSKSLKLEDNTNGKAIGGRTVGIPIKAGYDYIAEAKFFGTTGKADIYIEFMNDKDVRIDYKITSLPATSQWATISVRGTAPGDAVAAKILLYSNQSNVGTLYFDDVCLYEVTQEYVVKEINDAIDADDSTALLTALKNKAVAPMDVNDSKKDDYLAALKNRKAEIGANLSIEEIRNVINAVNELEDAQDRADVETVKQALIQAGLTLTLDTVGQINLPEGSTANGVSASWTGVSGPDATRILVLNGTATLISRPLESEGEGTATLTLTLSKGRIIETVEYNVVIQNYSSEMSELASVAMALTEDYIAGENTGLDNVTKALNLPANDAELGNNGISIYWSSTPSIVSSSGTISRPAFGQADAVVQLTATITKGELSYEKKYNLIVRSLDYDEARPLPVLNHSFEDGTSEDIDSWLVVSPDGTFEKTSDKSFTGEYSLRINDIGTSTVASLRTDKIFTAYEGRPYRVSAMCYAEGTQNRPYVYVEFWNNDGLSILNKYAAYDTTKSGQWQNLTVTEYAPVGTTFVTVMVYGGAASSGVCYFDNIRVEELPLLKNAGFEFDTSSWSAISGGGSGTIVTDKKTEGSKAIMLNDTSDSQAFGVRSAKPAVRPGKDFAIAVDYLVESGSANIALEFYNSAGAKLDEKVITVAQKTDWNTATIRSMIPDNTTSFAVCLSTTAENVGKAYFDNIRVFNVPYGLSVKDGSFEEITGDNTGYWKQSNASVPAVVANDKSHSGNASFKADGTTYASGLVSNNIPVVEGKEYVAVAHALIESGTAKITVDFWNRSDMIIQSYSQSASASENWKRLECKVTVPTNAQYATIKIEAEGGVTYFDDVDIYSITTSVSNASMENVNTFGAGTFPYNWKPYGDAFAYSDTQEYYHNMLSLAIADLSAATGGGVRSSLISGIIEGKAYTAGIMAKCEYGTMNLILEFLDENFNIIDSKPQAITGNTWRQYEVTHIAPTGTKYAVIALDSSDENMGIAYFDKAEFAPKVREIGSRTQLFIDDYMIESMTGITRTFHQAQKVGPIIEADKPWEGGFAYIYGTVLYDEQEEIYKMWYQTANSFVCYATSTDGINWDKPDLGIYEYDGNKNNNILGIWHIANVFKDMKETDPQKRYKMFTFNFDYNDSYYCVHYSTDGLRWSEGTEVIYGADVTTVAYDSYYDRYVGLVKINIPSKRMHRNVISDDLINWSVPIRMNSLSDPIDSIGYLRADGYGGGLYPYEGVYVGFGWLFQITGNDLMDGPVDVHLIFSRDLSEDWQRPTRVPIIPRGEEGTWDDGCIYTANTPIRMGDEIWLYYGGFDGTHAPDYEYHAGIGIAKWRLDGFASLDSTEYGILETEQFVFEGDHLFVNANASNGSLLVELLNEDGNVIPGFSKDDCDVITTDSVKTLVSWRGNSSVKSLEGRVISIRFHSENTELYSFGFKPSEDEDTGYNIEIGPESRGGAGYTRTISISGEKSDELEGKYLVVQFTEGTGVNANVTVIMMSVSDKEAAVSYQTEGTKVEAWLASGMPDLVGENMGVEIYAYASSVRQPSVLSQISITGKETVLMGYSTTLEISALDQYGDPMEAEISYNSLNPSIATVDENGFVTGVDAGAVTIRVTASANGINLTEDYTVRVLEKPVVVEQEELFTIQPDDGGINQFPDMFKFGDTIIVTFSKHMDAAVPGGLNGMRISRDNGLTFDEYYESSHDFIPGNMAQLKNGDLYFVGLGGMLSEDTVRCWSYVSSDMGKTWTRREGVLRTTGETFPRGGAGLSSIVMSGTPMVEEDGTLYNSLYGWYLQDNKMRCLWAKSTDNGLNWEIVSTIASGLPSIQLAREADGFAEPCVIRCADGSLLAVMRTRTGLPLVQCRSYDNGLTWTEPTRLPGVDGTELADSITGSVYPKLLMMSNGILVLSYGRPDAKLLVSVDGCGYQWDYFTVVYDDPTDGSQCSGMTGIVETEPGRLLICSDTGAVAYNPPVKSIWGKFVNVYTAFPDEYNYHRATIATNVSKVALQDTDERVHVQVFDSFGRLVPESEYTIVYTSDNPEIVLVDGEGKLTPVSAGSTTLRAIVTMDGVTHEEITASIEIIDADIITSLKYKVVDPFIEPNEETRILAWVENGLGQEVKEGVTITFDADSSNIVTVDGSGKVSAGSEPGKAIITITASRNGIVFTEEVAITVVRDIEVPMTFEGETEIPAGFEAVFNTPTIYDFNGNTVLKIHDSQNNNAATVEYIGRDTQKKIFEVKVYPEVLDKGFVLLLMDFNGIKEVAYQLNIGGDGSIKYFTDSAYSFCPAGTITQGKWYKFRIEADCLGETKVYIDDVFAGVIPKRTETLESVDRAQFIAGSTAGVRDIIYIDDFVFFEPTESNMQLATFEATIPSGTLAKDSSMQIETIARNIHQITLFDVSYTYESLTPETASVSDTGVITGLAGGSAQIKVTASKGDVTLEKVITLTVVSDDIDSVTATVAKSKILQGGTTTITAVAKTEAGEPIDAAVLSYASVNPQIAEVNDAGVITGVAAGTTNIIVTASHKGVEKSAIVSITVVPFPDDFESYNVDDVNDIPVDFTEINLWGRITEGSGYNGTKGFEIWDNATGATAMVTISKNPSAAKLLKFKLKQNLATTGTAGTITLQLRSSSGTIVYYIGINPAGEVSNPSGTVLEGAKIENNKWYEVEMVLIPGETSYMKLKDLDAGTEPQTYTLTMTTPTATNIASLVITCGRGGGVVDKMYLDDFMFVDYQE
ncbi:MAG TPA: hypothetical protein GXX20_12710 [Clostridiaceae bacterium]|nr:hypothetical protein [Clostridiaceae bacterium]